MFILGIDLGTSSLKAVLTDETEAPFAAATVPIATSNPRPGWSEQDPRDWWSALRKALQSLRREQPEAFRAVRAVGLSGQMHGAVLLDERGDPCRPAILWNDGRAMRECEILTAAVPDLGRIAGVLAMPGLTAPKLLWLKTHEPESFACIWKVVSPKDFLRFRMTGEAITDMSDAAGTLWLDEAARDWSDAMLEASGLGREAMPALVEGSAAAGAVRPALLRELGIDGPIVVAGGAGDVAAAAVGIGAVEEGDAFISLGTSAQFFVAGERYCPLPESLLHAFAHAVPGRWFRMAAMLNGASCLEWLARTLGSRDIAELLRQVEARFAGPSRVLFLPYLSGERTPHNDPHARGVFAGVDHSVDAADLAQAVLEGVAFSLLEAQELLERGGATLTKVAVVGGGSQSRFWMQLVAHVLGRPLVRPAGGEKGPAFGAARLARLAASGEAPAVACAKPPVVDTLDPDAALHGAYAARFRTYGSLYRRLRPD
jgi:xylulokinase